MSKRIIPSVWSDRNLAEYLLLYGNDVKLCIHCQYLIEKDDVAWCDKNDLSLDDYVVEKTTCRYFKRK